MIFRSEFYTQTYYISNMKTEYRYFSDITFLRKYTSPLPFLRKLLNDLFNQHGAVGLEIKCGAHYFPQIH